MKLCNKVAYASRDDALENRISIRKKGHKIVKVYLFPYVCPDCGTIHLTSQKPNRKP